MDKRYGEWIDRHYPSRQSALGDCSAATVKMAAEFPELRRVRGHVHIGLTPYPLPHWWCETPHGERVDPTAHQWPCGVFVYMPVDESVPQPTGMCPNCGGHCYGDRYLCSERCEVAYVAYCNGGSL